MPAYVPAAARLPACHFASCVFNMLFIDFKRMGWDYSWEKIVCPNYIRLGRLASAIWTDNCISCTRQVPGYPLNYPIEYPSKSLSGYGSPSYSTCRPACYSKKVSHTNVNFIIKLLGSVHYRVYTNNTPDHTSESSDYFCWQHMIVTQLYINSIVNAQTVAKKCTSKVHHVTRLTSS
jgi:hypothetical protein